MAFSPALTLPTLASKRRIRTGPGEGLTAHTTTISPTANNILSDRVSIPVFLRLSHPTKGFQCGTNATSQDELTCIIMAIPIVQVDAFTNRAFAGNPAAVCLLPEPRADAWMRDV